MKALTILFFACAFIAPFVVADDIFTFNGIISVGNETTAQEIFFTNNTYFYAPIQMSLVINDVINVANNTGFRITQNFQMVDTINGISLIVFSEAFEGTEETFTPITIDQLFNPCLAEFLKNPTPNLQFITAFDSNATADLDVSITLIIFNATIDDAQPITVPTSLVQYFTFISPTFGLDASFDLKFAILNTTANNNISAVFTQITVGCSGNSGAPAKLFNLTEVNTMQYAASMAGLKGAVTISLTAINGTTLPDPTWLFVVNDAPDSSSSDDLEGWQIALIVVGCVAGAILLATVVGVAVWFIRGRAGYSTL